MALALGVFSLLAADTGAAVNSLPSLATVSPDVIGAGDLATTLTLEGADFASSAVVLWDGTPLPTTFVSGVRLTAVVPVGELTSPRVVSVVVSNPEPGGGLSEPYAVRVVEPNPVPEVTGLSPSRIDAGGAAFALTVIGSGFVRGATVYWNGQDRATGFISDTQLTATVRASDIEAPGTAIVGVMNPSPGGGASGSVAVFTIVAPIPQADSLEPASVWAGGEAFTLSIRGNGFTTESRVLYAGVERATTYASPTQLMVDVPAEDIRYEGSVSVRVYTPSPGGGLSETLYLGVVADGVKPTTVAEGLGRTWHRSAVNLELVASDVGLGVLWTFWRDGDAGEFTQGSELTVAAPSSHANDGMHDVYFYSVDKAFNWEYPFKHVRVGIDTRKPSTRVRAATVARGGSLRAVIRVDDGLSYRVREATLLIRDSRGKERARYALGTPKTGLWVKSKSLTLTLPRGTYKMKVLARDLAGNPQGSTQSATLTVK